MAPGNVYEKNGERTETHKNGVMETGPNENKVN